MASTTTNYGLRKIDLTDAPPDITVLNENWDKIDTELKKAYTSENKPSASDTGAAPTSHASTGTTHGIGTSSKYGHVKLSDSTSSTSDASSGVAASSKAVKTAYDLANSKAPAYTYGATDLTAGSSALETGKLHFVYK